MDDRDKECWVGEGSGVTIFIACGKGEGLCNKVILRQRLKGVRVCYIKFYGKYVFSRGKSKGVEVGVCSAGLEMSQRSGLGG